MVKETVTTILLQLLSSVGFQDSDFHIAHRAFRKTVFIEKSTLVFIVRLSNEKFRNNLLQDFQYLSLNKKTKAMMKHCVFHDSILCWLRVCCQCSWWWAFGKHFRTSRGGWSENPRDIQQLLNTSLFHHKPTNINRVAK